MTNQEFTSLAEAAGFKKICFSRHDGNLVLIFLLMPYSGCTAETKTREAVISGYYPVSNAAYKAAARLSETLKEHGYYAESNLNLPLKPLLLETGIGDMGRNSLIAVEGLGSRFHIQTILTDCPFECRNRSKRPIRVADRCLHCAHCVKACPTGAIVSDMVIDSTKCLRAISEMNPPPEGYRPLMRNRLLGCDICQDVCPANSAAQTAESAPVIALKPLLNGDIEHMKALIGVNYARKKRLRIKAAIIAANQSRSDLLQDLSEMAQSKDPDEAEIAAWALKEILAKNG